MGQKRRLPPQPNLLLRQERLLHNWTQEDVAGYVGTDGYTVNRWERGRAQPNPYFRRKLCELFAKNAADLGFFPDARSASTHTLIRTTNNLPPYWSIPFPRNPCFIGREELLHTLHTILTPPYFSPSVQAPALVGLGGIGKTQLAIEYAYRYAQEYQAIFWLAAETPASLLADLQQIAEQLHLQNSDEKHVATAVRQWLARHSGWLLIVDNLEKMDQLQAILPPARQGALLLTSNRQALGTLVRPLEVPPMTEEEGVLFLLHRTGWVNRHMPGAPTLTRNTLDASTAAAARELVTLLDGLPLALDQAGAYMEETGCSVADYLQRYQSQRKQILAHRGLHGGTHPASVTTTLRYSIERVAREHPAALELLRLCACLHPEAIPETFFHAGASHLGPVLAPIAADPYEFDLVLAALRSASLVTRHTATHTFSIPRLVQAIQQENMSEQERAMWLKRALTALSAAFPPVQLLEPGTRLRVP